MAAGFWLDPAENVAPKSNLAAHVWPGMSNPTEYRKVALIVGFWAFIKQRD